MSKEYTQNEISLFFQHFKKLENSFTIEKVHQIINNPNARARYKVKNVKPLNLIIMTFLISLSVILTFMFASPGAKQESISKPDASIDKHEIIVEKDNILPNVPASKAEDETFGEIIQVNNVSFVDRPVVKTKNANEVSKAELVFSDTIIDGSKFILDLTNEELAKLGFKINHYSVYYRNSFNNKKVFYLSTHQNGRFSVRGDSVFYNMKDYYPLQTDTIPDNVTMKQLRTIKLNEPDERFPRMNKTRRNDEEYFKSNHSFYPLFTTTQSGKMKQLFEDQDFELVSDTLIPIVIKCSQLDLEIKTDQFFWFTTNDDFYSNLPLRYAWVKQDFENIKSTKRIRGDKFDIDSKIEEWNQEMVITDGIVLNGKNKIIQLSEEELEKIGIKKSKKGTWTYSHKTPYGGSSGGLTMTMVNGEPQNDPIDTIFNVDFYIKYTTDCFGAFMGRGMSVKLINEFLNENDILLPVQLENETGNIYWFTLSENLWNLVPERYTYLREYYNKLLYNKSLQPERDFVKYFNDPFEKVSTDVTFLELDKEELEKIGFIFGKIGTQIMTRTSRDGNVEKIEYDQTGTDLSCGFGNIWIQYKSVDQRSFIPQEKFDSTKANRINLPPYESVNFISPSKKRIKIEWTEKFDSLFQSSNQGYQFVYVTDSLGRHMQKISILQEDIQINADDFKYLIPVMVRQSKLANELSEDRVFWFTPTEAFFDRLPDRIKNELKEEYEIVSSEGTRAKLSSCTYFESCRSTLKVNGLKIYPNPAKNEITIDFSLDTAQNGEISLANIVGQQIKVLKPKSSFDEGFNSIKCQLDGIKPGIYLVSIVTDAGFKTERIIVSE